MLPTLALLLCSVTARAQDRDDPTWYAGRLVASVELAAGEGTLIEDDLRPLLRAEQDEPLDPATVQRDLRTLYRVTPLAAIEAEVVPWPIYDSRIDDIALGVKVRYVLYPSARVHETHIQGTRRLHRRQVLRAAQLIEGEPFSPKHDAPVVRERLLRSLRGMGFPDVEVEVEAYPSDPEAPFELEVWIRIDEGAPPVLSEVHIEGLPPGLSPRRVRRWARSAGLKKRKPVPEDALTRARFVLRSKLARLSPGPAADALLGPGLTRLLTRARLLPPGGWVEARVQVEPIERPGGDLDIAIRIEPGPQLRLETHGISQRAARESLQIDERLRLTRGFMERAPGQIESALARRGYREAEVSVERLEREGSLTLSIQVDRGHRYRRKRIEIEGNESLTNNQIRSLLNQASPDVLRRRRATPSAMERGVQAVRDLYRSIGREEAQVDYEIRRISRRIPLLTLDRSTRWLHPRILIQEGPLTRLRSVRVQGADNAAPMRRAEELISRLEAGPYTPQGLQGLAQQIIEIHRTAGFLDATARVVSERIEPRLFDANVIVDPGEKVLLRSFATRGNRRVSSRYLQRTLSPPLGETLDAATLDDLRQRLYELGMFSSVELSLLGDEAARDLIVDLRERPRHTVETGFGLASDQGVRALGRWTVRNVFAQADRIDTNVLVGLRFGPGTGGYALLPTLRAPEYRLGTNYTLPISRQQEFALSLVGQEEIQERNWRLLRRAVGLQWNVHPRTETLIQLRTRIEHRRLAGADPGALLTSDVWSDPALRLPSTPSVDTRGRLVDQIELVWLDDHRDNPLQPTRGVLASTRLAFSPQLFQPAYAQHLRVPLLAAEARFAAVVPVGALSLRLNAEGGHQRVLNLGPIASFSVDGEPVRLAVPVEERYRLGGTASLRGFRRDGVGPQQRVRPLDLAWPDALGPIITDTLRDDDSRWVPTGGDTFARATADLLIPLPVLGLSDWEGYDLALFMDVGQAWFARSSSATPPRGDAPWIRASGGVGVRVLTPVGPLQLDLAFNPQPQRQWLEPPARLHVSLGTLF